MSQSRTNLTSPAERGGRTPLGKISSNNVVTPTSGANFKRGTKKESPASCTNARRTALCDNRVTIDTESTPVAVTSGPLACVTQSLSPVVPWRMSPAAQASGGRQEVSSNKDLSPGTSVRLALGFLGLGAGSAPRDVPANGAAAASPSRLSSALQETRAALLEAELRCTAERARCHGCMSTCTCPSA